MEGIKLGYEVGTGAEVQLEPSHMIVTGLTQQAGKTTTLESLITRSRMRAIVFRTKIGEKSFLQGTVIPPFFRDRSDWQFVQGLVEATIRERLRSFERAKIIQICKQAGNNSLLDFKKRVDQRMSEKLNGFEKDILTNLQAYLEIVLPKLQTIKFSNTLDLADGLNIIDLERFSRDPEVQSLIIRSVAEEVLHNFKDVILVIPESWKFIPQGRGNPCKYIIEEFIRQGATNRNYIWIDSQDMTGVDKTPLKQVSTWILGYQSERNEVKHTLEQIPLPKAHRPKETDIMSLQTGVFYLATRDRTVKVYVQPFWLDDARAKEVALGNLKISELDAPKTLTPFRVAPVVQPALPVQPTLQDPEISRRFSRELSEMREDFFAKISDIQDQVNRLAVEVHEIKNAPKDTIDEAALIGKVLQKMPVPKATPVSFDREQIVKDVLARIPAGGMVTYHVAPLEKIKKDFLEEAKNKVIQDVSALKEEEKKALKYLEGRAIDIKPSELVTNCFLLKGGGSAFGKITEIMNKLLASEVVEKTPGGRYRPALKKRIESLLLPHSATPEEIEQVYNHVLASMLNIGA